MKVSGVVCPKCYFKTDQSPCPYCGYEFPDFEQEWDEELGLDRVC